MKPCLISALILLASGCDTPPAIESISGFTQGTTYHIRYWTSGLADKKTIEKRLGDELARIDKLISNYREDSAIAQFNANETTQPQEVDQEITGLLRRAVSTSRASDGCYDLTHLRKQDPALKVDMSSIA